MRILVTNDDGIEAAGIESLTQAARQVGIPVVVAPSRAASGCSHQTTTDRDIQVARLADDRFAVDGTPADCVRLGLLHLAPDVDWVLSGINHGGNLGVDILMSGTVAAAREAVLHGVPAIAVSRYRKTGESVDWSHAQQLTAGLIARLISKASLNRAFWNINLPDLPAGVGQPEVVFCEPDPNPLPIQFKVSEDRYRFSGDYHQRPRNSGSDVDVCFGGSIAVSRVTAAIQ